jgi:hypothetical protein
MAACDCTTCAEQAAGHPTGELCCTTNMTVGISIGSRSVILRSPTMLPADPPMTIMPARTLPARRWASERPGCPDASSYGAEAWSLAFSSWRERSIFSFVARTASRLYWTRSTASSESRRVISAISSDLSGGYSGMGHS